MKVGVRKPSIQKRVKARTTGRIKRTVKKSVVPFYGQKGIGYVKNPKKALKNKIYHKLTIDPVTGVKKLIKFSQDGEIISEENYNASTDLEYEPDVVYEETPKRSPVVIAIISVIFALYFMYSMFFKGEVHILLLALSIVLCLIYLVMDKNQ